jgi:hypothetical protein
VESLTFKKWLENYVQTGTGLEPPKEDPMVRGQGALADYPLWNSKEKPPTKANNFKMKRKCRRK